MKRNKVITLLILSVLLIFSTLNVSATTNVKVSFKGSQTLAPGQEASITMSFDTAKYELLFDLIKSNNNINISSTRFGNGLLTFKVTAVKEGTTTLTVKPVLDNGTDMEGNPANATGSFKITVKKPSTPTPKPPTLDNTEDDKKKPPVKTPEEIAKDKLEERRNTPLISGISISSDSERLNGEVLKELPVQKGLYNYRYVLPRSIDAIILDVKGSFDDVELVYDKNIKLEDESLAVKIIAKQDVITQEYVLTLERPVEISTTFRFDNDSYRVIEDDYLSVQMRDLGFTKSSFDVEDATKGSFFNLDSNTVVLAVNENNDAKWLLLDDNLEVDKEVVIVGEEKGSLLVPEVDEAVDKKLQGTNSYETIDVNIPVKIKEVDTSLKFKETVGGWSYDDTGAITHALNSEGEIEIVHLGSDGEVKQAYVIFDQSSGFSFDLLTYGLIGLWFFTILVFSIDRKRTNRKINTLISRRNAYNNEG